MNLALVLPFLFHPHLPHPAVPDHVSDYGVIQTTDIERIALQIVMEGWTDIRPMWGIRKGGFTRTG